MTAPADAIFRGDHTVVNLLLFHDAAIVHLKKKWKEANVRLGCFFMTRS